VPDLTAQRLISSSAVAQHSSTTITAPSTAVAAASSTVGSTTSAIDYLGWTGSQFASTGDRDVVTPYAIATKQTITDRLQPIVPKLRLRGQQVELDDVVSATVAVRRPVTREQYTVDSI
jgi:hypothetical protein